MNTQSQTAQRDKEPHKKVVLSDLTPKKDPRGSACPYSVSHVVNPAAIK